jgi:hypothetical protein
MKNDISLVLATELENGNLLRNIVQHYCLYLISCAIFLSLIIFKIIPHPMTLLTVFPLQVIISYLISYCLLSLPYCHITYPLSSSHIPSPHIHHTHRLNPFS